MMTKELPVTVTKSYQRGKQNVTYSMKKKSQQSVITVPEKERRTLERNPDTGQVTPCFALGRGLWYIDAPLKYLPVLMKD